MCEEFFVQGRLVIVLPNLMGSNAIFYFTRMTFLL